MVEAENQAAYNGAYMVYSRNKVRSFLERPNPPGYTFVSTFTTDGTTLHTFAHYSSDQGLYHQYPTSSTLLIASYNDFRKS
jgi:hypothetical protein